MPLLLSCSDEHAEFEVVELRDIRRVYDILGLQVRPGAKVYITLTVTPLDTEDFHARIHSGPDASRSTSDLFGQGDLYADLSQES